MSVSVGVICNWEAFTRCSVVRDEIARGGASQLIQADAGVEQHGDDRPVAVGKLALAHQVLGSEEPHQRTNARRSFRWPWIPVIERWVLPR